MKNKRSTMNVIFSQKAQYRLRFQQPRGVYEPTVYAHFEARFADAENVLVCIGKCETFGEDVPLWPTLRRVMDMEELRSGNYAAHAVRIAVAQCDQWFERLDEWRDRISDPDPDEETQVEVKA